MWLIVSMITSQAVIPVAYAQEPEGSSDPVIEEPVVETPPVEEVTPEPEPEPTPEPTPEPVVEESPVVETETEPEVEVVVEEDSSGEDGVDGGSESSEDVVEETVIETGDAVVVVDDQTVANTNTSEVTPLPGEDAVVEPESEEPTVNTESEDLPAEVVEDTEVVQEDTSGSGGGMSHAELAYMYEQNEATPGSLVVADNDANLDTDITASAGTGDNHADGNSGVLIDTGDAMSVVNVINVANTNVVNSQGLITLLNAFEGQLGDLDLDQLEVFNGDGTSLGGVVPDCAQQLCGGDLASYVDNDATFDTDIVAVAQTGDNTALETQGDAVIKTGDAIAAVNVFNVANTNIVDSQYLLLAVNNIGDWEGDITLPGANDLMEMWTNPVLHTTPAVLDVDNTNEGDVVTEIDIEAGTGDNTASGTGSDIETGDTVVMSNVFNQVNQNHVGGDSFVMLIKVHGDWNGDVLGAPEGLEWQQTEDGLLIFDKNGSFAQSGGVSHASLSVTNTNTAKINTHVSLVALTGGNEVSSEEGDAMIHTGDATALANVYNIVNTNVVGQNWFLAMFNIFGDWDGDIIFGRPDLWIGSKVKTPHKIKHGNTLTYTYTIMNRGDQPAKNVRVSDYIDEKNFIFGSSRNGVFKDGLLTWSLGDLAPGKRMEVSYTARVKTLKYGQTYIFNEPEVVSDTKDKNEADNSDEVVVVVENEPRLTQKIRRTNDPVLIIQKTNSTRGVIEASSTVDYQVVIENRGGMAYHTTLLDTIVDQWGNVVYQQFWQLGYVGGAEEIIVDYSVFFDEFTRSGVYTNYAIVKSIGRHPSLDPMYGVFIDSNLAKSGVVIKNTISESIPFISTSEEDDGDVSGEGSVNTVGDTVITTGALEDEEEVEETASEALEEVSIPDVVPDVVLPDILVPVYKGNTVGDDEGDDGVAGVIAGLGGGSQGGRLAGLTSEGTQTAGYYTKRDYHVPMMINPLHIEPFTSSQSGSSYTGFTGLWRESMTWMFIVLILSFSMVIVTSMYSWRRD